MSGELTQTPDEITTSAPTAVVEAPKVGRPSTFTQDLANTICAQLAEGRSLRSVLTDEGMPAMSTVFKWLNEDQVFSEQYARAKEESADALADDIADIAEKVLKGVYDPAAARVALDGKKWFASKMKPKKYGDRIQHANDPDSPMPAAATLPADMVVAFAETLKNTTKQQN